MPTAIVTGRSRGGSRSTRGAALAQPAAGLRIRSEVAAVAATREHAKTEDQP